MQQIIFAMGTIIVGVFGCVAYFYASNIILDRLLPPRGSNAARNINRAGLIRPWLFLGPAVLLMTAYLVYPVISSLILSLSDSRGQDWVGLDNYLWLVSDDKFRESMRNNLLWLVVVPTLATMLGLIAAALTDRIKWGNLAKSMIFMPMAISFVGAAVIWKFIYDFRGEGREEIGLLNAVVELFGGTAQVWVTIPFWNNFFLMVILVWIQTGFAMVILSAALRGIPEETIEAAILDGASPLQVFWRIKVPQIWGTIAVVWTTITILVLKVFDIVFAMTNGQWGTQVLANMMYDWSFRAGDFGRGSAVAIVLMILVVPIMILNIRNARQEMR